MTPESAGPPNGTTLVQRFEEALSRGAPTRGFIFFEDDVYTYSEIKSLFAQAAEQLRQARLDRGDKVVTLVPTTPVALCLLLAIGSLGAVCVPLKPDSSWEEFEYALADSRPRAIVMDAALYQRYGRTPRAEADLYLVVSPNGPPEQAPAIPVIVLDREAPVGPTRDDAVPDDVLLIAYTSGSTGRPKGVMLSHRSCTAVGEVAARRLQLTSDDTILGVLPIHYFGGMKMASFALACGGGLMMQRKFSRTRFWHDVSAAGATAGILMPAMMAMLLTDVWSGATDIEKPNASLRTVISHIRNREFEERFGVQGVTTWGQSELAGIGTLSAIGEEPREGYVGTPVDPSVEIEIRAHTGDEVPVGQTGEIFCRHPWRFLGYLNADDETARALQEGFVATGDLGHLSSAGELFYDGRIKNMIKRSGENIAGAEVERVVEEHPAIVECASFGVPDPIRTEELKVVVVARKGAKLTEADIVTWCADRLAGFKVPRFVEIRPELPRLPSMKVDRMRLREEHTVMRGWDREVPAEG